jgi:hypothetical protein
MMRLMRMWQLSLVGVLSLAACGGDGSRLAADEAKVTSVPEEFHDACGKPGSEVMTERSRVVVKHADCDLTGVIIGNRGGGATVPERGGGVAGSSSSGTVTIRMDSSTGDVTFTAGS